MLDDADILSVRPSVCVIDNLQICVDSGCAHRAASIEDSPVAHPGHARATEWRPGACTCGSHGLTLDHECMRSANTESRAPCPPGAVYWQPLLGRAYPGSIPGNYTDPPCVRFDPCHTAKALICGSVHMSPTVNYGQFSPAVRPSVLYMCLVSAKASFVASLDKLCDIPRHAC